jgi:hypothetical protein
MPGNVKTICGVIRKFSDLSAYLHGSSKAWIALAESAKWLHPKIGMRIHF